MIKAEISACEHMQKEHITLYVKSQQCNHDSAKHSKAAWIPLDLGFACGAGHELGIVPTWIQPADKGMGSCTGDLNPQGEHRERKGRCWSRCSLVPPPLWAASIVCASSNLSQWPTRNVEKFVCNLGNDTEPFAQMPCALWKFRGFPCDSQDRGTQGGLLLKLGLKEGQTNFLIFLAVK